MVEMGVVFTAEALARSSNSGHSCKIARCARKTVPVRNTSRRCTRLASNAAPERPPGSSQTARKGNCMCFTRLGAYESTLKRCCPFEVQKRKRS